MGQCMSAGGAVHTSNMDGKQGAVQNLTNGEETGMDWFDPVPYELMLIFYSIFLIYIDLATWILADKFFAPCLDHIIFKTGATISVGGLLIYGGAISLLGFVTSTIDVFVDMGVEADVSIGKILGDYVYEFTLIIALSILFVPAGRLKPVLLRPLVRDIFFVALTTLTLFLIFFDGKIDWFENIVLVVIFIMCMLSIWLLRKYTNTANLEVEVVRNFRETSLEDLEVQETTPINGHNTNF